MRELYISTLRWSC